jgi:drug/metabolite transporter (DMT)-like permease
VAEPPPPTKATVEVADRIANSAAPMLAGLIGALIGVVGTNAGSIKWPGPALAALALAVLLLLASMQAWIRGQSHFMTFAEVQERVSGRKAAPADEVLSNQHAAHANLTHRYRDWTRRSQWCFQLGLSIFLVGLALVVVPPLGAAGSTWRWSGAALTLAVALVWAAMTVRREWRDARWARQIVPKPSSATAA